MIAGLFKLILFAFLFYVIFLAVRIYSLLSRRRRTQQKPQAVQGVMVKDEICNTYIPKSDAVREFRDGQEHYFCSQECRRKFLKHETGPPPPAQ